MVDRFTDWDIRLSAIEKVLKTRRAGAFAEHEADDLYMEIRQYNNARLKELNMLNEAKRRAHDAVLFPAIREEIASWRVDRKWREISQVAKYDARADALRVSVAAAQRQNYS